MRDRTNETPAGSFHLGRPIDAPRGGPRGLAYRLQQGVSSAWLRRRHHRDFDGVGAFCLFAGYPRSGHSVVGACINAHPDAVISHELNATPLIEAGCSRDQLYSRILARAAWFNLRGNRANYDYAVPGQWQGRFRELRVIGDKRGGAVTRGIAADPGLLERIRSLVGAPLRLIHVVRNPLDNIAAISRWHRLSLSESADLYFEYCRTTARLGELCDPQELLALSHESFVEDPRGTLTETCRFLGLETIPAHLDACSRLVFARPTKTRNRAGWPDGLVEEIEARAGAFPALAGYRFD